MTDIMSERTMMTKEPVLAYDDKATGSMRTEQGRAAFSEQEKFISDNSRNVLEFINKYEPTGSELTLAISRDKRSEAVEIAWRLMTNGYVTITLERRYKITEKGKLVL